MFWDKQGMLKNVVQRNDVGILKVSISHDERNLQEFLEAAASLLVMQCSSVPCRGKEFRCSFEEKVKEFFVLKISVMR